MAKEAPFSVLLRDLPTHRRFEVTPIQVTDWLRGMPMRDALGAPEPDPEAGSGVAELDLYTDDKTVFVSGEFHGHLVVACSRCVGPVTLPIDETLRVTYLPRGELPTEIEPPTPKHKDKDKVDDDEGGAELGDGDLDVFPYDGEAIDLEPLFREQFVLSVPYAPLCREDCKGLCPQCGIDRNTETCACEKPMDPRLAALKGLKIPS